MEVIVGMGVLIKNMDMPKTCDDCAFCYNSPTYGYAWCVCLNKHFDKCDSLLKRQWFCPLSEFKPCGNLIDRDALSFNHAIAKNLFDGYDWNELVITKKEIMNAPVVIKGE